MCVETLKIVFCSKNVDSHVSSAYARLNSWFDELKGVPLLEEEKDKEEQELDEEEEEDGDAQKGNDTEDDQRSNESEKKHIDSTTWKPFGAYFDLKLQSVGVCSDSTQPINPLCQPEFLSKLLKNWLPTSPFWSSMLRGIDEYAYSKPCHGIVYDNIGNPKRYKNWSQAVNMSKSCKEEVSQQYIMALNVVQC